MLTGQNGILTQAQNAKELTSVSTEKEAIQIAMTSKELDKLQGNESEYSVGKPLYEKSLKNSNIWDVIVINETQEVYDTGWRYIEKGTNIKDYGDAKYNWLVSEETGEVIRLEEGKYTELSYNDELAVTEGLIFNVDSNNMNNNDLTSWGEGVTLYGFENNEETESDGLEFDGEDDYVEFKSTADYSKGFTLSFYGKNLENLGYFFAKQRENDIEYSCRFCLYGELFSFNTSKNRSDSKWAEDNSGSNGNLNIPCSYILGDTAYFDLTFDAENNEFKLYKNNELVDSDTVNPDYWNGENGGKQIFEDDTISCYIGRVYRGNGGSEIGEWNYSKITIYSLRLYNRSLNESELKSNYDKTVAAHTIE